MTLFSYDEGPGTNAEIYLENETDDWDAIKRDSSFPLEIFTTNKVGEQLVEFISTQLSVMQTLKIHHLSELPKELNQMFEGLREVLASANEEESEPPF